MGIIKHNPEGFFGSMDSEDWKIFDRINEKHILDSLKELDYECDVCGWKTDELFLMEDNNKKPYGLIRHDNCLLLCSKCNEGSNI